MKLEHSVPLVFAAVAALSVPAAWAATAAPELDAANPVGVRLVRDVAHGRAATEQTEARLRSDGRYLDIEFDAKQREPIVATQRTNNVNSGSDDEVWVDLWPSGPSGFGYQFFVNPIGTHYQTSTENSGYEPSWESHGEIVNGGYSVSMKIPLGAIRGAHAGNWRVQFGRLVVATGEEDVWTFGSAQSSPDDLAYAGTVRMPVLAAAIKPQPRVAVYGLGEAASRDAGPQGIREGADLSIPLTPTAAFYATVHPDFSNVELDQQSIAPTPFARYLSELRPFFTQGSNFYNNAGCFNGPCVTELYTPSIPTPREGYAIEGQQGRFIFASFDAVGDERQDLATTLDYATADLKWAVSLQRVAVTTPTLLDDVSYGTLSYNDRQHVQAYFDYGTDSGSDVKPSQDARRYDLGATWNDPTFAVYANLRKVGDGYAPADGYVPINGIAGYGAYAEKIWLPKPNDVLQGITFGGYVDRYQGESDGEKQSDNKLGLDFLTKHAFDLNVTSGSSYLRLADGVLVPVSQSGIGLTYHSGTQENSGNFLSHGPSATPTTISFNTGRYGSGLLDSWLRSTTMRAGSRGTVTLELDDTAQRFDRSAADVQWFERAGYLYQLSADSSFAFGIRRAVGTPPAPNGGGDCIGRCTNIAASYHLRMAHSELYVGYGDPNALSTAPQAIVKFIYYVGAQRGT